MARKSKTREATEVINAIWARYAELRDSGHLDYVDKAERCEDFFVGLQWDKDTLALLHSQRRPALTINKIIKTVATIMGEQIYNRTDISFRPRGRGATDDVADALTKVFMQISDNNQLSWLRSDVFTDGIVSSRGFYDVRMDYSDNLQGEVRIQHLNPKNVLIDSDADEYDPNTWNDVLVTKWVSESEIAELFGEDKAKKVRLTASSINTVAQDALETRRDRFGDEYLSTIAERTDDDFGGRRGIRLVERQWRRISTDLYFLTPHGDLRLVPQELVDDEAAKAAYLERNPDVQLVERTRRRIRWTIVAGDVVLYDDWSPYDHFTVVPYFPYFRRGRTVGLVENLIGPQELLNKVSSQELHVVNTSANSGWKVKTGALQNMSIAELEHRGAESGIVLELTDMEGAEKITSNSTPTGLDRISYKADEHMKDISSVSDYMTGNTREDVSAKAVQANQAAGSSSFAAVLDSLRRSDFFLARNILGLVQRFYTEERLIMIVGDRLSQDMQQVKVNEMTPEGTIVNDLTLGEYMVIVSNEPERDTLEDSQFEQAKMLRQELGVMLPDSVLIESSRLRNKTQILQTLQSQVDPEEEARKQQIAARQDEATTQTMEAEAQQKQADAQLKNAKAAKEESEINKTEDPWSDPEIVLQRQKMEADIQLQRERLQAEMQMNQMRLEQELELKRQDHALKQQMQREDAAFKRAQMLKSAQQQETTAQINKSSGDNA